MKDLYIIAPEWDKTGSDCAWKACYHVKAADNVRLISIESRSAIDVVIAKIVDHSSIFGVHTRYYISVPNFGIAIPWIGSLSETKWITEQLIGSGMPAADAVTIVQVLQAIGDF